MDDSSVYLFDGAVLSTAQKQESLHSVAVGAELENQF
jgi:hypothetical protein